MDFTFYIAGFIAVIVGFVAGVVFIAVRGKSKLRLFAAASGIVFALDWAMLIDWSHIRDAGAYVLVADFLFFAIYSVIGCMMGTLPALLARYLWRKRSGQGSQTANSN